MEQENWFVGAIKDLANLSTGDEYSGLLYGLSGVLETYANEVNLSKDQYDQVIGLLRQPSYTE